jgi:hypothetical protein
MTPPLGLVAHNATFDKNPRLETVVGFLLTSSGSQAKET